MDSASVVELPVLKACRTGTGSPLYNVKSAYSMSFQNTYAPAPPTICPYPFSIWVSGGPKAGAMVEEICGQPNDGVVFHGSSTVGVLLASMPQIVSLPNSLSVSA